jgi:tubulin polyglutamylase TTLL6/13
MLTVKPAIPKKKRTHNRVWFWANDCKYEVILDNAKNINWVLITDEKYESKVNIYWIDVASIHERLRMIQPWQIINHFPGMPNIARKNRMGQNLNKMLKLFPVRTLMW